MLLKNTSRYPIREIRELLTVAAAGLDLAVVEVHVKNTAAAMVARSYNGCRASPMWAAPPNIL
jgi:hypothetical protein